MKVSSMMVSTALLATGANATAVETDANELLPNAPVARIPRGFPFKSKATWHEVCMKYNKRRAEMTGSCDTGLRYRKTENGATVAYCPKGSIRMLSSQPVASCIQAMIL